MFAAVTRTASWRALAAAAPAARGISASRIAATAEGPEDPGAELEEGAQILGAELVSSVRVKDGDESKDASASRRWTQGGGYDKWLAMEGRRFQKMVPGRTNFVTGTARPFPLNRAFNPRPPLSDAAREAIYKEYLGDPVRMTPRILGEKHGVSIKRVEAILKLKALERHAVKHDGFTLQTNLTKGMESMFGLDQKAQALKENLVSHYTRISGPRFHAVPEGEPFGAAEAAEVLGRRPFQEIMDRLTASTPFVVDYEGLDPAFAPRPEKKLTNSEAKRLDALGSARDEVLEKNEALASRRWKYVFTDTSKKTDMRDRFVLVREKDGTLKKANREYKLKRYRKMWYH